MPSYKIMLVDDEQDILDTTATVLRHYGIFEVDTFADPLKALDHFQNHSKDYSIVISDIRMPGMSGIEFLEE